MKEFILGFFFGASDQSSRFHPITRLTVILAILALVGSGVLMALTVLVLGIMIRGAVFIVMICLRGLSFLLTGKADGRLDR